MSYYKLRNTIDIKQIGKYPQSVLPKSIGNIRELGYDNKRINNLLLPEPVLHAKAKLTTYLQIDIIDSFRFLVIQNRFLNLLKEYELGPYQSWTLNIEHNDSIVKDYSLFYLVNMIEDSLIDFSKSELLIGKLGDWKDPSIRKKIKVDDYQHYYNLLEVLKESKDNSEIRYDKLVFDLSKTKLDMFRLGNNSLLLGYFVSERLKNAIEAESFTGLEFIRIEDIDERVEIVY